MNGERQTDTESGVEYEFKDGLLSLFPRERQAAYLSDFLRRECISLSRLEFPKPEEILRLMRTAWMRYQLLNENKLTELDRTDAEVLYSQDQIERNEWYFRIANKVRFRMKSIPSRVPMAMVMAMDVVDVMTD